MRKKVLVHLICFLSALVCSLPLAAESSFFDNYVYQDWSTFGGLTGTTANDIIQSRDGFINIGTYEGLIRFDGVAFTTLRRGKDNDYKFISVRTMLEDSKGDIWLGSNDEGVQKISSSGNKIYSIHEGLPSNSVRTLCEDREGNIWIGTAAGVVYLTPDGRLISPQFQSGTVAAGVISVALYCDTAGRVWLATANQQGLFLYTDGIFRTIEGFEKFGNYFVSAICQDSHGDFWFGLSNLGLARLRNGSVEKVTTHTILDTVPTWSIFSAPNGTLWFGTEKGLFVLSNGVFSGYERLPVNTKINRIIRDREDNIWIATDRNGIGKLTHGKFRVTKLGCSANAIAEDPYGRIWIGTDEGVMCYQNEEPVENSLTKLTKGIRIRHVGVASNGDILVSCYKKPAQLRYHPSNEKITSWTSENGLAGDKVRVVIESENRDLYVGTTTGLSVIHPDGVVRTFMQKDGLENEYVMCIYEDKNGIIWIGTDGGGIYLMKNERIFQKIDVRDGLAGNIIFKIFQDKDGFYWICTGTGISRCPAFDSSLTKPVSFETINSANGLGTDSIFQIIPDQNGVMWMTSNYGISSATYNEVSEAMQGRRPDIGVKFYNKNDGLDSDGATSTALALCDHLGKMWFPMVDGFAIYDPIRILKNPVLPLVCIESITVDSVEYKNLHDMMVLKPGTKRVEIKYTGLSFDAPERILFTHQLTNFENEFSEPSRQRSVSYTNLKPGKHTFLVNAINGDGLISDRAETLLFVQKPYIYQIPVFWICVALFVFGFSGAVVYLKQRAIVRENARLERMVLVRTAELAQEKEKSDKLLRSILPDKIADELRDDVHSIAENFADATLLFSDIVSFTKTSSGHTAEEIVEALNDLFSRFDDRAKSLGVEKIKTIGDAYMAACGIPEKNPEHARIMVEFARGMYEDLAAYNVDAKINFSMRIGLNCGPVNAGVIGKSKFIYDVWGNTVNVASRMESVCTPGRIRVSQSVYDHLKDSDVVFSTPIECDVKGKGVMTTYEIM